MKRIRITAALAISAALMTISVGTQAASSDDPDDVAVLLPALVCGGLDRLLSRSDILDADAERVSIDIEIVGPPPRWDDSAYGDQALSPWASVHPPVVSLFSCWNVLIRSDSVSQNVRSRTSSDIAVAP